MLVTDERLQLKKELFGGADRDLLKTFKKYHKKMKKIRSKIKGFED